MTRSSNTTSRTESKDDEIRLAMLAGAAELGYTGASEDEEHVVVLLGAEQFFHDWVEHQLPEWKLRLTPTGRRCRKLGDGMWHEWEEQGRINLLDLPPE
jgi:hypothetical protein